MEEISSSVVRLQLSKKLRLIYETGNPIAILHNAVVVARLTLKEPAYEIPPLRIRLEEARKNWGELLDFIAIRRARYFFRMRFGSEDEPPTIIYMVPASSYRNPFSEAWREHVTVFRNSEHQIPSVDAADIVEDLKDALRHDRQEIEAKLTSSLDAMDKKITCLVALINRKGNMYATPELGIVPTPNAADLDRYEAD